MAEIIWTQPALQELDAIADYIALDNPQAARRLVRQVFEKTGNWKPFPAQGERRRNCQTPHIGSCSLLLAEFFIAWKTATY